MAVTDPIADFLTRIRNAQLAGHKIVDVPSSKVLKRITEILYENGYIEKYKFIQEEGKSWSTIKIALRYDPATKLPVIRELKRVSKPGRRYFAKNDELPRIINGLGIAIVSTSRGMLTDKQARSMKVGGEVMCMVY
jgi:small subunit ribosomal protein S8